MFAEYAHDQGVILGLGLSWPVLHRALVSGPRGILGLAESQDWILVDPDEAWTVKPESFQSRGRNTPFVGRSLRGRVVMTVCRGRVAFEAGVQVG